jgi:hypothetical protein
MTRVFAPFDVGRARHARSIMIAAVFFAAASCRSAGDTEARKDSPSLGRNDGGIVVSGRAQNGGIPIPSARDGGAAQTAASASSAPIDSLGTIYPHDAPSHPLATRLCEVLHAVPAQRKAECCGGEPAPFLATECARVLGATLHAGTVDLDESAVERCAAAIGEAVGGCEWVTPSPLPAPDVCQRLLRGKLERGRVCRSSLECAGDMHCEGVSPTKTGVCTPPGGEGAGCGTHVDVLATYLLDHRLESSHPFCAEHCARVAHKCGPPPKVGSACLADINCASSQVCVAGRCSAAARGGRGESCSAVPCAERLRCIDQECAPLASAGETCRSDAECATGGCVRGDDGRGKCGPQCSATLDALRSHDGGVTMGLPRKPRADGGPR